MAISPTRVEPRASSRFATFTHAISSTRAVETSNIVSGVARNVSIVLCPRAPGSKHQRLGAKLAHHLLAEIRQQRRVDVVDDRCDTAR